MDADHQSPAKDSSQAGLLDSNPRKRPGNPLDGDQAHLPSLLSGLSIHKSFNHGKNTAKPESAYPASEPSSSTSKVSSRLHPTRSISQNGRMSIDSQGAPQSSLVQQRKRVKLENPFTEAFKPDDRFFQILQTERNDPGQRRIFTPKPVSHFAPTSRRSLIESDGCNLHPLSGRRLPDPPASLDGLPTELKLMVLREIHDMQSLDALVRASALYSRAYFDRQEVIFNKQTFKEIRRRGVRLIPAKPAKLSPRDLAWLEVSIIGGGPPPPDLGAALFSLYTKVLTRPLVKPLRLSIEHCRALLTISDVIGWAKWVKPVNQTGPTFAFDSFYLHEIPQQRVYCPPSEVLKVYSRGLAHYHPLVFNFPGQRSFTLAQVGIFREVFALIMQGVFVFGPFPANVTNMTTGVSILGDAVSETQLAAATALRTKFGAFAHVASQ